MNLYSFKNSASLSKKLALFFLFLFVFTYFGFLNAQNCENNLSVEVIDLHDGTPLDNAIVVINELQIQRTTNQQGKLIFKDLFFWF